MIELSCLGVLLVVATGTGYKILCRLGCVFVNRLEELCFSLAVGFGALVMVVLVLGLSHLLYHWVIYTLVAVGAIVSFSEIKYWRSLFTSAVDQTRNLRSSVRSFYFWLILLAAIGMGFGLLRALAPPHGATDPIAYQLALPKIFLVKHFLSFEPTITGALYPTNMGLLYIIGMGLRNDILAQLLHWLMGAMCLLAVVGFAQKYLTWQIGVWAAAIFSFVPIMVVFGPQGYVDVGLCFFQFMAFWAVFNWAAEQDRKSLVLAALLTGLAMGFKHQGMATLFVAATIVLGRGLLARDGLRLTLVNVGIIVGLSLLVVGPWYVRAYMMAGNPIWPLANGFFGGAPFKLAPIVLTNSSGDVQQSGLGKLLPSFEWFRLRWSAMSPWSWTFTPGGAQKWIGTYFVALVPGLIFYARSKRVLLLTGFCFFYLLVLIRMLHMNPRYGLVLFAFLSILCGYVIERLLRCRVKVIPVMFKVAFVATTFLNISWAYALAKPVLSVSTGVESREQFLTKAVTNYRVFRYANNQLSPSARILLQGIVRGYYCDREYLWDHPYQATINYEDFSKPDELLERMRQLGITHVVRMIHIPSFRQGFFPQYFADPFHEEFRKRHLKALYKDEAYVLFKVVYR